MQFKTREESLSDERVAAGKNSRQVDMLRAAMMLCVLLTTVPSKGEIIDLNSYASELFDIGRRADGTLVYTAWGVFENQEQGLLLFHSLTGDVTVMPSGSLNGGVNLPLSISRNGLYYVGVEEDGDGRGFYGEVANPGNLQEVGPLDQLGGGDNRLGCFRQRSGCWFLARSGYTLYLD